MVTLPLVAKLGADALAGIAVADQTSPCDPLIGLPNWSRIWPVLNWAVLPVICDVLPTEVTTGRGWAAV